MKSHPYSGDQTIAVMGYGWGHGAKGEKDGQDGCGYGGYWVDGDGAPQRFLIGDGWGDTGAADGEGDGDSPGNPDGTDHEEQLERRQPTTPRAAKQRRRPLGIV